MIRFVSCYHGCPYCIIWYVVLFTFLGFFTQNFAASMHDVRLARGQGKEASVIKPTAFFAMEFDFYGEQGEGKGDALHAPTVLVGWGTWWKRWVRFLFSTVAAFFFFF